MFLINKINSDCCEVCDTVLLTDTFYKANIALLELYLNDSSNNFYTIQKWIIDKINDNYEIEYQSPDLELLKKQSNWNIIKEEILNEARVYNTDSKILINYIKMNVSLRQQDRINKNTLRIKKKQLENEYKEKLLLL